jgi:hypothetical protein
MSLLFPGSSDIVSLAKTACAATLVAAALAASSAAQEAPARPTVPPSTEPRDFQGPWRLQSGPGIARFAPLPAPALPSAQAQLDRVEDILAQGKVLGSAWTTCRPGAMSVTLNPFDVVMIVQADDQIDLLFEQPRMFRQLFLRDGSPAASPPRYRGHSTARWEGDVLVVETVGMIPSELDNAGHPIGQQGRVVERISKSADGMTLSFDVMIEDPESYAEPFHVQRTWRWAGGERQVEFDCAEDASSTDPATTIYLHDSYQPTCLRREGVGGAPSRVICERPAAGAN